MEQFINIKSMQEYEQEYQRKMNEAEQFLRNYTPIEEESESGEIVGSEESPLPGGA